MVLGFTDSLNYSNVFWLIKHIQAHLLELPHDIWNSRERAIEVRKGIKWGQGETSGGWFQDSAWSDLIKKIPRVVWFPESSPPATMCTVSTRDGVSSMGVWPGRHEGPVLRKGSASTILVIYLCCCCCCSKSLLNLLQFCFWLIFWVFFFFWPQGMWDLSFPTRDWTLTPCIEGKVLTTGPPGKSLDDLSLNLRCGSEVSWDNGECVCVCEDRRS